MNESERVEVLRLCYRWVLICANNVDELYAHGLPDAALLFEQYLERWLELAGVVHRDGLSYDEAVDVVRATVEGRPVLSADASRVVGDVRREAVEFRPARTA